MSYDPKYAKKWRVQRSRGIKQYVPAAKVAGHCLDLENAGMSRRGIAEAAGVTPSVITSLMHGQKNIRRVTAAKILAVTPEAILGRDRAAGFVPAIGLRRRIRALYAIGHTAETVAEVMQVDATAVRNRLNHPGRWVRREWHDRVVQAYALLWDKPGPSALNRSNAAKFGWAPPLAWDDDTIDDPNAVPHTETRTGQRTSVDVAAELEDLLDVVAPGITAEQASARLGYRDAQGVYLALKRANRPELRARLDRNNEAANPAPLVTKADAYGRKRPAA